MKLNGVPNGQIYSILFTEYICALNPEPSFGQIKMIEIGQRPLEWRYIDRCLLYESNS